MIKLISINILTVEKINHIKANWKYIGYAEYEGTLFENKHYQFYTIGKKVIDNDFKFNYGIIIFKE